MFARLVTSHCKETIKQRVIICRIRQVCLPLVRPLLVGNEFRCVFISLLISAVVNNNIKTIIIIHINDNNNNSYKVLLTRVKLTALYKHLMTRTTLTYILKQTES